MRYLLSACCFSVDAAHFLLKTLMSSICILVFIPIIQASIYSRGFAAWNKRVGLTYDGKIKRGCKAFSGRCRNEIWGIIFIHVPYMNVCMCVSRLF